MLKNELHPVLVEIYDIQCGVGKRKPYLSNVYMRGAGKSMELRGNDRDAGAQLLTPMQIKAASSSPSPLIFRDSAHSLYHLLLPFFHTHSRLTQFPLLSKDSTHFLSLLPHSSDPILSSFPQRRDPICLHPSPCTCGNIPPPPLRTTDLSSFSPPC